MKPAFSSRPTSAAWARWARSWWPGKTRPTHFTLDLAPLRRHLQEESEPTRHLPPLAPPPLLGPDHYQVEEIPPGQVAEGYLGVDVGSISTNVVVIDPKTGSWPGTI